MEELIPILVWGLLIFLFSSGGAKQKKKRAQMATQARLEARRRRMEQDRAAGGLVGVAEEDEGVGEQESEFAWGTREPMEESRPSPPPVSPATRTGGRAEPQVPRDVWELVEALARGRLPTATEPPEEHVPAAPTTMEPLPDRPSEVTSGAAYEPRPERVVPAPAADAPPRAARPLPTRRSLQERG